MAHISYSKLWESDFVNIVSKREKVQDLNIKQIKLQEHDSWKKKEKLTTNFEPTGDSDVINKSYLDEKTEKGHIFYIKKDFNEFNLQYNKQSVEEFSIQRSVKTTIQLLYDKGLFDSYAKADKVLEEFVGCYEA